MTQEVEAEPWRNLAPVQSVDATLSEVAGLLSAHGHSARATFVSALVSRPHDGTFWSTVAGLEFWGGSGAVWEAEPFHLAPGAPAGSQGEYRRFQVLLVQLSDILKAKGLAAQSSRAAELFRREIGSGESDT